MSKITENILKLTEIISKINSSCEIVAASKTRSVEEIAEAYGTGKISAFGENRAQELCEKYPSLPNVSWDFIGRLQLNKVKYVVGKTRLIHSLDSLPLAEEIEKQSAKFGVVTDVLIEINADKEQSKGGIYLEETESFLEKLSVFSHIRTCGMMAVTERNADINKVKDTFDKIYVKFDGLKTEVFRYLSMGMSDNYIAAVEAGANIIRPGRVIFGERNYGETRRGEDS